MTNGASPGSVTCCRPGSTAATLGNHHDDIWARLPDGRDHAPLLRGRTVASRSPGFRARC